jgi:hypothetical protein
MKSRAICYLDATLDAKVAAAGAKKGWSKSSVIEAALKYFFSSAIEHERDALIIKRLDEMNRRLARMERDQQSLMELCDLGMRYQIAYGPRLSPAALNQAVAETTPAFEFYRSQLERRLAPGRKLLGEALADAIFSEDDFAKPKAAQAETLPGTAR